MQFKPLLPLTMDASGAVTAERFVTPAGAQATLGSAVIGVARQNAIDTEKFTVDTFGTAIVASGAAVAKGAAVKSDANGKAVTHDTGAKAAIALQAATGADQRIEVLLLPSA